MKYANISNNMYVNQYDGESRVTALAIDPSGRVDLFSVPISTPSGQLQLSEEPILGKTRQINDIFNKQGNFGGSTSGEVTLTAKTASISIKNDYAYLSPVGMGIEMSRNAMKGILSGDGFHDQVNGVYRSIVGTNGAIKRSSTTDQNYIFKKLFEIDGRLKIADAKTEAGHAVTQRNTRTPAYDKTCLYMVFENITKLDDDNIDGIRVVYTMNSEVSVSDATDANEVSFTQTQLSDIRHIKEFFISGFADDEVGIDTSVTTTVNLGTVTVVDDVNNKLTFAGNLQPILNVGEVVKIAPTGDILPKTLTVSEIAYLEGAKATVITFTEDITAGSVIPANTATASNTNIVSIGVPARPAMIAKTPISMFKKNITTAADIVVNTVTSKIDVTIVPPTEIVSLNSVTQEYETVAYTPAINDVAIVYISKAVLQDFIDNTGTVKADGSVYAIARFDGAKWSLANQGKVKETLLLTGAAVTAGTFADAAAPTAAEKKAAMKAKTYETYTWNFETTRMERI